MPLFFMKIPIQCLVFNINSYHSIIIIYKYLIIKEKKFFIDIYESIN